MKPKEKERLMFFGSFAAVFLIFWIDYVSGFEISFSIFYLLPVTLATWGRGKFAGIFLAILSAFFWFFAEHLGGHQYSHPAILVWNSVMRLGYFLMGVIVALYLKRYILRFRMETFKANEAQLRLLTNRLRNAREQECARMARIIHDDVGQYLTATKMNLVWMERKLKSQGQDPQTKSFLDRLEESEKILDESVERVRELACDLRLGIVESLGLGAALEWEAGNFKKRTGIACDSRVTGKIPALPFESAAAVFRIFQELLTNTARHAEASNIEIDLRAEKGYLELRVKDNGRGIRRREANDPRALGIIGMRERAFALNGILEIAGAKGKGTEALLRVPLGEEK